MKSKLCVILGSVALAAFVAGCQPVTTDFEGRQRTSEQIAAQVEARLKDEARQEESEQKKAIAAAKAAADEAARAQRTLERRYAATIRGVDRDHEDARAAASEELQASADAIGVELSRALAQITANRESALLERTSRVEGLQAAAREAIADIEAKEAQRGWLLNAAQGVISDPAVAGAVGGLPGGGLLLGLLASGASLLGGVALRGKGSKARHDKSYEEGKADGAAAEKAKAEAADKAWEESQKAMELQLAKLTAQLASAQAVSAQRA